MKQYRLLKDLPDADAGTIFTSDNKGAYDYLSKGTKLPSWYDGEYVENNFSWFEEVNTVEKVEQIEVTKITSTRTTDYDGFEACINVYFNTWPDRNKYEEIKKAIEQVLNPEPSSKKEEGWEILEGKSSNGKVHQYLKDNSHGGLSCKEIGCEIFSVLRKSDNTVFTVGDETTIGVIKRFEVSEELMYWWNEHTWYYLSQAIKAPTNTVEDKPFVWTDELVERYRFFKPNIYSEGSALTQFKKLTTNE